MSLSEQKCRADILKDQCKRFSGRLVVVIKHAAVNPLFSLSLALSLSPSPGAPTSSHIPRTCTTGELRNTHCVSQTVKRTAADPNWPTETGFTVSEQQKETRQLFTK